MDASAEKNRHGNCHGTAVSLVHGVRVAQHAEIRRGATIQDRILSFLKQQRHQARTLLPLQPRVQRTSRGSCEEYQNIDQSLPQARRESPASHRGLEKHGTGRRCIPESAVLWTKTETAATPNSFKASRSGCVVRVLALPSGGSRFEPRS